MSEGTLQLLIGLTTAGAAFVGTAIIVVLKGIYYKVCDMEKNLNKFMTKVAEEYVKKSELRDAEDRIIKQVKQGHR